MYEDLSYTPTVHCWIPIKNCHDAMMKFPERGIPDNIINPWPMRPNPGLHTGGGSSQELLASSMPSLRPLQSWPKLSQHKTRPPWYGWDTSVRDALSGVQKKHGIGNPTYYFQGHIDQGHNDQEHNILSPKSAAYIKYFCFVNKPALSKINHVWKPPSYRRLANCK